jgi:hypothetical protein
VALVVVAGLLPGSALASAAAGWSIQPSPNPAGTIDAELASVACTSARACISVGHFTSGDRELTLAERWNGTSWALQATPNAPGTKDDILSGVSCAGATCTAVGYSFTTHFAQRPLAEVWNGTTWTVQPTPSPAGPSGGAGLDAVSCTAPDSCMAVGGFSRNGSAQSQPLAERWNGSAWTVVPAPNPHAENGSSLVGVSCTAASACTAGGDFDYADVAQSIFALRWNGATWAMQKQPNPRGQDVNGDNAVSCTSASACTSAGYLTNGGNVGQTLAEAWNGTTWSIQPSPNPAASNGAALAGVSCPSTSACSAVGYWTPGPNGTPVNTLAEHWNGTRWSLQSTPSPAGTTLSALSAVACIPGGACVAVGDSSSSSSTKTLVERNPG